jgi:Flp pilus assembly protein TadG
MNRRPGCAHPRNHQDGVAAVELALLSMLMLIILFAPVMIAESLLESTVVQRAAFNAGHIIATYPPLMRQVSQPAVEAEAAVTDALVNAGLAAPTEIDIACPGSLSCKGVVAPKEIYVTVGVDVLDPLSTRLVFNKTSITISASDRYAN